MGYRQPAPAFFSMAELPAPPAPAVPVVVAEEPAPGVVPADAELQPPPVVEAEVFLLIVLGFFAFLLRVFRSLSVYCTFGLFRLLVFLAGAHLSFPVFAFPFLKPNLLFLVIFFVLYNFVLLCTLPVLRTGFSFIAVYICCALCVYFFRGCL